jgi:hypothetical protein
MANQLTMDQAIIGEILSNNTDLIIMALGDAAAWRSGLGEDDNAAVYEELQAELGRFQDLS